MQSKHHVHFKKDWRFVPIILEIFLLAGCSGGNGPAIEARAQTISFSAAPTLSLHGIAIVSATASSGLAVNYSSVTPTICSVDGVTGQAIAIAVGTCTIAANQSGDSTFAPAPQATQNIVVRFDANQTISFSPAPLLTFGSTAKVAATATSGLPVTYTSSTPSVCTIDSYSGLVTDLTAGACAIIANQPGDANYYAAPAVALTMNVDAPVVITAPGIPAGVTAALGSAGNSVTITVASIESGGSPITSYTATSSPNGLTATSATLPIAVTCASSCSGYTFAVTASNGVGTGAASNAVEVITNFNVVTTFYEPDTQPRNSIFTGTFTFNSTTGVVSNLRGVLTESMTGDPYGAAPFYGMTELTLSHQLSSITDAALGGLLVTTFRNNDANTFTTTFGGDGWSPEAGVAAGGIYYGFPVASSNPGNAYTRIFVNTQNPLATLTQAQIDKLAYADCAPGGMMGAACMTGTTVAGYGGIGTMSGYPLAQVITKQ